MRLFSKILVDIGDIDRSVHTRFSLTRGFGLTQSASGGGVFTCRVSLFLQEKKF